METGAISDAQVTASSEYSVNYAASRGRLHGSRAWAAGTTDVNQWLQIDLGGNHPTVARVATQGQGDTNNNEWVTEYKIKHSNDGVSFYYYREQGQAVDKASFNKLLGRNRCPWLPRMAATSTGN